MYLISGNITSNVTGNLLVITGNGNIGNITSNFRTLVVSEDAMYINRLLSVMMIDYRMHTVVCLLQCLVISMQFQ